MFATYGHNQLLENVLHDFNGTVSNVPAKHRRMATNDIVFTTRRGRRQALAGRQEMKFFDTSLVAVPNTVSLLASLNPIPRGTSLSERIGRKIYIRSLEIFYTFVLQTTPTISEMSNEVRVLVLVDKQTNGSSPAILDVLETASVRSFHNLDHSSRFVYVWDKRFAMTTIAGGGTHSFESNDCGRVNKRFRKSIVVEFEEPGTGILSTITTHNLLCFVVTDRTNTQVDLKFRIRYTDGY